MIKKISTFLFSLLIFSCSSQQSENNIYALLIANNDTLIEESYFNGKTPTALMDVQSITKSILSLLVGIAIDKEYIANENVPILTYFPEESELFTGKKKEITIKHLLNHTAGLNWKGYLEHEDFLQSQDPVKYVLAKEIENTPGEKYNYNSGGTHLLSVIISKVTGKTTLDFAKEVLFKPLQIDSLNWSKLNDGIYDGAGFGLSMNPKDLIKIGQLMLDNGNIGGNQIISQNWIRKSFDVSEKKATNWGIRKSKHGYGWYSAVNDEREIFYSMGYGGQFIFIIPSTKKVIVCLHNADTSAGIQQQVDFLSGTLPELIGGLN